MGDKDSNEQERRSLRPQKEKQIMPPIPTGLDTRIAEYLTAVIRHEMQAVKESVAENNKLLKEVEKVLRVIKTSLSDCSARVDTIVTSFLPSLSSRVKEIAVALAERTLDIDVHSRK